MPHQLRALVDVDFSQTDVIRLVSDNLNTHHFGALFEAFPPAEARRVAKKLEWHHTPMYGSWLNVAEVELAVVMRQYFDRRLGGEAQCRQGAGALALRSDRRTSQTVKVIPSEIILTASPTHSVSKTRSTRRDTLT